jgi:hypothetical protein
MDKSSLNFHSSQFNVYGLVNLSGDKNSIDNVIRSLQLQLTDSNSLLRKGLITAHLKPNHIKVATHYLNISDAEEEKKVFRRSLDTFIVQVESRTYNETLTITIIVLCILFYLFLLFFGRTQKVGYNL